MTATTTEPRVEPTVDTPPTAFRGLVRTTLRLHRSALWFWLLLLALAAGALVWVYGSGYDAALHEYTTESCARPGAGVPCEYSSGPAYYRYSLLFSLATGLLNLVPLLTAAWAGASLSRELESGTAALAWTQSVSPARWLAAALAVPAALLITGTAALSVLHHTVWSSTRTLWNGAGRQWFYTDIYLANGPVLVAHVLLGLAVGSLAGLLARRVLPALATAAAGLVAVQYVLTSLRPHLWPVETLTGKDGYRGYVGGMPVEDGALISTGARIEDPMCVDDAACLTRHDVVGFYSDYHPSSHSWPLQLVETGIVLALVAAVTATAFALLRRRTA